MYQVRMTRGAVDWNIAIRSVRYSPRPRAFVANNLNGDTNMKRKLGLFVVSAVMLGGIYSPAPAAEIDCNSLLTQLAINSLEEDSSSVPLMYAHCVPGALRPTPAFEGIAFDPSEGVAGRPGEQAYWLAREVRENYVTDD